MSTLDYSISLEKQPTWTIYKELPTAQWLKQNKRYVDTSEYEEYSFTGKKSEIESQRSKELNKAGSTAQVQATMTRLNGNLWQLTVRKNAVKAEVEESEDEHPDQEYQEQQNGSLQNPRQVSVNITAIQESILNHEKFEGIPPDNLGAIKMYMNGAGGSEKIGTSQGVLRLDQLMSMDDELVQLAIKNPTYYVPSMSITFQYWSSAKETDMSGIGKPKDPPGGIKFPEDYTSLYMGCSSSPSGSGYVIQETYTVGKFNKALYESK